MAMHLVQTFVFGSGLLKAGFCIIAAIVVIATIATKKLSDRSDFDMIATIAL